MREPELYFPVRCPVCGRKSLAGFRLSVVEDALRLGHIRLYAGCHVASWDGSDDELRDMRVYLDETLEQTWGPYVARSFKRAQAAGALYS